MRETLHMLTIIFMVVRVLNISLIVSQGWLPNSKRFVQTYPLLDLIISQNHVFDCFSLISDNNWGHPAIQKRQSYEELKLVCFTDHTTSSVNLYSTHIFRYKPVNILFISPIIIRGKLRMHI